MFILFFVCGLGSNFLGTLSKPESYKTYHFITLPLLLTINHYAQHMLTASHDSKNISTRDHLHHVRAISRIFRGPGNLPPGFWYFESLTLPALHQSNERSDFSCWTRHAQWGTNCCVSSWTLMNVTESLSSSSKSQPFQHPVFGKQTK